VTPVRPVQIQDAPAAPTHQARRRGLVPVLLAVAGVLVVAAAVVAVSNWPRSNRPGSTGPPPAGTVDAKTPVQDSNAYAGAPITALPGLTAAETSGLHSAPWLVLAVAGSSIDIVYAGGPCATTKGVYISETPTAVLIAVLGTIRKVTCAANLVVGRAVIHLREPLADRELLHAMVDPFWGNALSR
jgi:hypothetical protein